MSPADIRHAIARLRPTTSETGQPAGWSGWKAEPGTVEVRPSLIQGVDSSVRSAQGVSAHYRRRREHGDWHNAARRHLLNRFLGQLHHCLQTRQPSDEQRAFAPLPSSPTGQAA